MEYLAWYWLISYLITLFLIIYFNDELLVGDILISIFLAFITIPLFIGSAILELGRPVLKIRLWGPKK